MSAAIALYDQIVIQTVPVSSMDVAEAVKLTENIFSSVNISLVTELKMVPVPNNMSNHFKTLVLTVNRSGKAHLSKSTRNWATREAQNQFESGN